MQPKFKFLNHLMWISQLGFSILTPLVLCIGIAYWLQNKFNLGAWIMVLGIVLGLGAAASAAWSFSRIVSRQAEKKKKDETISFNSHE